MCVWVSFKFSGFLPLATDMLGRCIGCDKLVLYIGECVCARLCLCLYVHDALSHPGYIPASHPYLIYSSFIMIRVLKEAVGRHIVSV